MMKLKASLAGTMRSTMTVKTLRRATGPNGVPNGFIEEKNEGNGSSPCLAISRSTRA